VRSQACLVPSVFSKKPAGYVCQCGAGVLMDNGSCDGNSQEKHETPEDTLLVPPPIGRPS
jgi:hypothetical protein